MKKEKVLVTIQLSGGNDYLNCIVPWENPLYRDFRKHIKITDEEIIPLDNKLGLNPGMNAIKDFYNEGNLAIIHGVGYPEPNRSHFRSMDIWHTAEPTKVGTKGWLGQAIKEIDPNAENVVTAVNFSEALPRALVNQGVPVASVGDIDNYGLFTSIEDESKKKEALNTFRRFYTPSMGSDYVMDYLGKTGLDAVKGAEIISKAPSLYNSNVEYPNTSIGKQLKGIAQVHFANFGTRIFYANHGGFDTHTNEMVLQQTLWQQLSDALSAFFEDLKEHDTGEEIIVFMFSEFGRRVIDNGTGTDHGSGGVSFLLGNNVKGGQYNDYPSLDPDKHVEGDLKFNFDFRGLYSDILEDWLSVEAKDIVGGNFEKLSPFVK
jgi:uncharacterized protein (DUF1501 family)